MSAAQLRAWELENSVKLIDTQRDALYALDTQEQKAISDAKPWRNDHNHFKNVRISAVALLKMGKIAGDTFIVTDAFRLPVEGTETRVNASDEANAYIVRYLEMCRQNGLMENAVGWYHSHPGYGCWLSGIDVGTQSMQQSYQDPFLAVVIDPDRTISAGKVEIGAFRTYPEHYKPPEIHPDDDYQMIPTNKTEDFGAHANRYYSLEISHYKSTLDTRILEQLWNKYWVSTLSQSPLITNREYSTKQILDLNHKIKLAEKSVKSNSRGFAKPGSKDAQLEKVVKNSDKIAVEEDRGLLAGEIKTRLFSGVIPSE